MEAVRREMAWGAKDHLHLGAALDLFDFEAAAEVSGSKFYYMRRAGDPAQPGAPCAGDQWPVPAPAQPPVCRFRAQGQGSGLGFRIRIWGQGPSPGSTPPAGILHRLAVDPVHHHHRRQNRL